jgi:hypothetical protein
MKKEEFISKVRQIPNPKITEDMDESLMLLNTYWVVESSDYGNFDHFCTPSVKLSYKPHDGRDVVKEKIDDFYKRESKIRKKYLKWFSEAINQKE